MAHQIHRTTCYTLMHGWEQLGGGMARCRVYTTRLDGVGYLLDSETQGANAYESERFGKQSPAIYSESLVRLLRSQRAIIASRLAVKGRAEPNGVLSGVA